VLCAQRGLRLNSLRPDAESRRRIGATLSGQPHGGRIPMDKKAKTPKKPKQNKAKGKPAK